MSMTSILGKIIIAGLVSKGVSKMMGRSGGGLGTALTGMLAGGGAGGLGSLLSGLAGSNSEGSAGGGGIGDILGSFMGDAKQSNDVEPTDTQNQQAEVLLRAMLNAAKSDGDIDKTEQQKIVDHLGDVSDEEAQFVRNEMAKTLDVDAFIQSVPRGMEKQVYLISLTAIDLDTKKEAEYLHHLAQGLRVSNADANAIHKQVGAPELYR